MARKIRTEREQATRKMLSGKEIFLMGKLSIKITAQARAGDEKFPASRLLELITPIKLPFSTANTINYGLRSQKLVEEKFISSFEQISYCKFPRFP